MAENWKMPAVRRGDIVDWYEGGVKNYDRGCAAVVIKVHHDSVALRVFGIDHDFRIESTRHLDDPNAKETERHTEGGWTFPEVIREPEKKAKS